MIWIQRAAILIGRPILHNKKIRKPDKEKENEIKWKTKGNTYVDCQSNITAQAHRTHKENVITTRKKMLRRSSFFSWERKFDYPEARIEPDIKEKNDNTFSIL